MKRGLILATICLILAVSMAMAFDYSGLPPVNPTGTPAIDYSNLPEVSGNETPSIDYGNLPVVEQGGLVGTVQKKTGVKSLVAAYIILMAIVIALIAAIVVIIIILLRKRQQAKRKLVGLQKNFKGL